MAHRKPKPCPAVLTGRFGGPSWYELDVRDASGRRRVLRDEWPVKFNMRAEAERFGTELVWMTRARRNPA